jgi:hypothetical protein
MWVTFGYLRPSGHIMPDHGGDRGAAHLDPGASRSPPYQPDPGARPIVRSCESRAQIVQPRRRGGSSRVVISATASAPGRTYRIAVRGLRCRVLAMISCSGMPCSQLVGSGLRTMLNTSAGAGSPECHSRAGDYGMGLPGCAAGPGQEAPPVGGCNACRPRPRCAARRRVAWLTGELAAAGTFVSGRGMHEVQRERLVARSGA